MGITPRRALILVIAAAGILAIGLAVGTIVRDRGPGGLAPDGSLFEFHTVDGTVYLGDLTDDTGTYLEVSAPAVVLPGGTEPGDGTYRVVALTNDPYAIVGPILIPRDQIVLIGAVAARTSIEQAYLDAIAGRESPSSPAPS